MKIQNVKGQAIEGKSSLKKTKKAEGSNFFSLLEGHLHPTESVENVKTPTSVSQSEIPAQLRLDGVYISESTIDLLESFGNSLDNLDIAPDDLTPIIDALEDGTTSLLDIKEQLPDDDPLAQLIDRVATISIIETEKFRRGDYN